jgi:hypothetical protein
MKLLYSVRNVYGDHINKALTRGDSVFCSYWLRGRVNALRAVHTMPLLIASAVHWHSGYVEIFGPVWSVPLTRLAMCDRLVYMLSISFKNEIHEHMVLRYIHIAWVRSCGICGGQNGTGAGFVRVLQFPLPIRIPLNHHLWSGAGAIGQTKAAVRSGLIHITGNKKKYAFINFD